EIVFFKDQKISIHFQRICQDPKQFFEMLDANYLLPVSESFHFNLQPGSYQLKILLPGVASYGDLNVLIDGGTLEVKLEPGADVNIKLITPKNIRRNALGWELMRDGKVMPNKMDYYDYATGNFHGLPYGKYVLKILGSTEQPKQMTNMLPEGVHFGSLDIPFQIDINSPPVLEVGEFSLPQK
ncbi:MAG: hypothetical protein ABI443_10785, partial [Chthoniobacterales bacterium]